MGIDDAILLEMLGQFKRPTLARAVPSTANPALFGGGGAIEVTYETLLDHTGADLQDHTGEAITGPDVS